MFIISFKSPFTVMGKLQWFNHSAISDRGYNKGEKILVAPSESPSQVFEATVHSQNRAGKAPDEYGFVVVDQWANL